MARHAAACRAGGPAARAVQVVALNEACRIAAISRDRVKAAPGSMAYANQGPCLRVRRRHRVSALPALPDPTLSWAPSYLFLSPPSTRISTSSSLWFSVSPPSRLPGIVPHLHRPVVMPPQPKSSPLTVPDFPQPLITAEEGESEGWGVSVCACGCTRFLRFCPNANKESGNSAIKTVALFLWVPKGREEHPSALSVVATWPLRAALGRTGLGWAGPRPRPRRGSRPHISCLSRGWPRWPRWPLWSRWPRWPRWPNGCVYL